jgi:hypothetical protein
VDHQFDIGKRILVSFNNQRWGTLIVILLVYSITMSVPQSHSVGKAHDFAGFDSFGCDCTTVTRRWVTLGHSSKPHTGLM